MTRLSFHEVWDRVEAISGVITTASGKGNEILVVDRAAVVRVASTGRRSSIPISAFRFALERLETVGHVAREEILAVTTPLRVSSGLVAVLGSIGRYDLVNGPAGLRLSGR